MAKVQLEFVQSPEVRGQLWQKAVEAKRKAGPLSKFRFTLRMPITGFPNKGLDTVGAVFNQAKDLILNEMPSELECHQLTAPTQTPNPDGTWTWEYLVEVK